MDHLDDPTEEFLKSSRFWIQRVFVPILVLIGVIGNVVTVMVLTRKRMRCTTTIYLTALAVADILYLFFVLLLSFEHYPNINDIKYELYWRFSGINHWLCDAASSTSVWLTVSFTIERYIVVCHPIRGKILCTENRAKSIIAIIGILCLMTTASTVFEYQLNTEGNCSSRHSNNNNRFGNNDYIGGGGGGGVSDGDKTNESDKSDISNDGVKVKSDDVCTIRTEATNLGKNDTYTSTMNWYAAIFFGLLPVILIATFNCFLISAVYRSQKERKLMTNLHDHVKMYQENRITLLLIGIVVLFLVCQTPTATFLIYDALDTASYDNRHIENVKKICGNVFNLLLSINAACNFLLYCVLSDRYRRTFKALFCCNRNGNNNNGGTLYEITRGRITQRLASHRAFNKIKRNNTTTAATTATTMTTRTPRNLEAHSLTSIPRSKSLMVRQLGRAKSSDMNV